MLAGVVMKGGKVSSFPDLLPSGFKTIIDSVFGTRALRKVYYFISPFASTLVASDGSKTYVEVLAPNPKDALFRLNEEMRANPYVVCYEVPSDKASEFIDLIKKQKSLAIKQDIVQSIIGLKKCKASDNPFSIFAYAPKFSSLYFWQNIVKHYLWDRGFFSASIPENGHGRITLTEDGIFSGLYNLDEVIVGGVRFKLLYMTFDLKEEDLAKVKERIYDNKRKVDALNRSVLRIAKRVDCEYAIKDTVIFPASDKLISRIRKKIKFSLPIEKYPSDNEQQLLVTRLALDITDADSPYEVVIDKLLAVSKAVVSPQVLFYLIKIFYILDGIISFVSVTSQILEESKANAYLSSFDNLSSFLREEERKLEQARSKLISIISSEVGVEPKELKGVLNPFAFRILTTQAINAIRSLIFGVIDSTDRRKAIGVSSKIQNTYTFMINAFLPLLSSLIGEKKSFTEFDPSVFESGVKELVSLVKSGSYNDKIKHITDALVDKYENLKIVKRAKVDEIIANAIFRLTGIASPFVSFVDIPALFEAFRIGERFKITDLKRAIGEDLKNLSFNLVVSPRAKKYFKDESTQETFALSSYLVNAAYKGVRRKYDLIARNVVVQESEIIQEYKEAATEAGIGEQGKDLAELLALTEEYSREFEELTEDKLLSVYSIYKKEEVSPERRYRFARFGGSLKHLVEYYSPSGVGLGGGVAAKANPILDVFTSLEMLKKAIKAVTDRMFGKEVVDESEIPSTFWDEVLKEISLMEGQGLITSDIREFFELFVYNIILSTLDYVASFFYRAQAVEPERKRAEVLYRFVELLLVFVDEIKRWIAASFITVSSVKPFTPQWLGFLKQKASKHLQLKKDFVKIYKLINSSDLTSLRGRVIKVVSEILDKEVGNVLLRTELQHLKAITIELMVILSYLKEKGKTEYTNSEIALTIAKFLALIAVLSLVKANHTKSNFKLAKKTDKGLDYYQDEYRVLSGEKIEQQLYGICNDIVKGARVDAVARYFDNVLNQIKQLVSLCDDDSVCLVYSIPEVEEPALIPLKEFFAQQVLGARIYDPAVVALKEIIAGKVLDLLPLYKAYFGLCDVIEKEQLPVSEVVAKYPGIRKPIADFLREEVVIGVERTLYQLAVYFLVINALESASRPTALMILKRMLLEYGATQPDVLLNLINVSGMTLNTYFAYKMPIADSVVVRTRFARLEALKSMQLPMLKGYLIGQWNLVEDSLPYYGVPIAGIPSWAYALPLMLFQCVDLIPEEAVKKDELISKVLEITKGVRSSDVIGIVRKSIQEAGAGASVVAGSTCCNVFRALEENIAKVKNVSEVVSFFKIPSTEVEGKYSFSIFDDVPSVLSSVSPTLLDRVGPDINLNNFYHSARSFVVMQALLSILINLPPADAERKLNTLIRNIMSAKKLGSSAIEAANAIYNRYCDLLLNQSDNKQRLELDAERLIRLSKLVTTIANKTSIYNVVLFITLIDFLAYIAEAPRSFQEFNGRIGVLGPVSTAVIETKKFLEALKFIGLDKIVTDQAYGIERIVNFLQEIMSYYRNTILEHSKSYSSLVASFATFREQVIKPFVLTTIGKEGLELIALLKTLSHISAFDFVLTKQSLADVSEARDLLDTKDKIISQHVFYATALAERIISVHTIKLLAMQYEDTFTMLARRGRSVFSADGRNSYFGKIRDKIFTSLPKDKEILRGEDITFALAYLLAALKSHVFQPINDAIENIGGSTVQSVIDSFKHAIRNSIEKEIKQEKIRSSELPQVLPLTSKIVKDAVAGLMSSTPASRIYVLSLLIELENKAQDILKQVAAKLTLLKSKYPQSIPAQLVREIVIETIVQYVEGLVKVYTDGIKNEMLLSLVSYYNAIIDTMVREDEITKGLVQLILAYTFLSHEPAALEEGIKYLSNNQVISTFKQEYENLRTEKTKYASFTEAFCSTIARFCEYESTLIKVPHLVLLTLLISNIVPRAYRTQVDLKAASYGNIWSGVIGSVVSMAVARRTIERFSFVLSKKKVREEVFAEAEEQRAINFIAQQLSEYVVPQEQVKKMKQFSPLLL